MGFEPKPNSLANASNDRREGDFYPTPWEATQALINTGLIPKSHKIWEPACGNGAMVNVLRNNGFDVVGTDIQQGTDFLDPKHLLARNSEWVIITNPPFKLSVEFIQRCSELNPQIFALLLKSQYWHSAKRLKIFRQITPAWVLPLTWRPDFRGGEKGGNPLMDVLWTVWIAGDFETKYLPLERPAGQGDPAKNKPSNR
jgi:hypothetical protein